MKSFSTLVFAASVALVSAQQPTFNTTTGTFICPIPNAAYCAGDSRSTNIIIRCNGVVGHAGNCNDNLDGEFPFGVSFSPCFQTSAVSGDAACTKNCVIYGASGNYNGPLRVLPNCTPAVSPTSSSSSISRTSSTTSSKNTSSSSSSFATSSHSFSSSSSSSSRTNTTSTPTRLITATTPSRPTSTSQTLTTLAKLTAPSGAPSPLRNSTTSTNALRTSSRSNVPVGPTSSATATAAGPAAFTGGAAAAGANQAGAAVLAVLGSVVVGMLV